MDKAAPAAQFVPVPPALAAQLARAAAAAAGAIGLAVLLGWALDLSVLTTAGIGRAMQPWTAVGLVLGALTLWLAASPERGTQVALAVLTLALVAIAGAPLIQYVTGLDLGTDRLLFPESVVASQTRRFTPPGRMTPLTALGHLTIAAAMLLALRARGRVGRLAFSMLATAGLMTAGVTLLGYALGLEPLNALLMKHVPPLHTGIALGLLAVGALALRPEVGWVSSVAKLGRAGWVAAGLLGAAVLLMAYGAQATLRAGTAAQDAVGAALRLEVLLSTLKDAETGQRGYLLTGNEDYLQPYRAALARLPDELATTDVELPEGQSASLVHLQTLADATLANMAETIALRRSGDAAGALAVVETGRGRAIMDEIRATAGALSGAIAAEADAARAEELRAAMLAGVGGLGLVGLAFWAMAAAAEARRAAEVVARESGQRFHEMQMELAHANRVATMGQLTASIAHEVKQPIAATFTNAQAALRWLGAQPPELEEVRQALARIAKDANRAGDVIGRIRGLIGKAPPQKDALAINEAIREVLALLQGEAVKHGVSIQTRLAEGLPLIQGDRVQLQQVILNLIVNAIEAMASLGDGARDLLISTEADASGAVRVSVRDSGPGLDPQRVERLFEAFYTTKPGGLGMGLSICRSIIEAHGGRFWASANEPRGAVFQFTLPPETADTLPAEQAGQAPVI
ncbi:CHASE3 domain-containing protein [Rhizobium mongolense]|uniref:CHASE3 domain-containing protein n=1 Tax=Rhizobium mongolense TaxID=57676 RepID=UPI003558E380